MLTNASNPMLDAVRNTPAHFAIGWDAAADLTQRPSRAQRVVICGMGGSAFPGDILRAGFGDISVPVVVSRDYDAPLYQDGTLYIVSSFSGNTEETIATLAFLVEAKADICVVTAGGRLAAMAGQWRLPLVLLNKPSPTFQPRAASGIFVSAFAQILVQNGLLDAATALNRLSACATAVADGETFERHGKAFAEHLLEATPVFYSTGTFVDAIAQVAKIKFNENSKIPSFYGAIPELNHNEMVGYTQRYQGFLPILFRDPNASERVLKRIDTTAATLLKHGVANQVIDLEGQSTLEQVYRALLVMDYASIELAARFGVDPNPVEMVEGFKADLGFFSLD